MNIFIYTNLHGLPLLQLLLNQFVDPIPAQLVLSREQRVAQRALPLCGGGAQRALDGPGE